MTRGRRPCPARVAEKGGCVARMYMAAAGWPLAINEIERISYEAGTVGE